MLTPGASDPGLDGLAARATGANDVVIVSSRHDEYLHRSNAGHVAGVIKALRARCAQHYENPELKSAYIFMHAGKRFGPTQLHPHGQLLAFPFVPKRIQSDLGGGTGQCVPCTEARLAPERRLELLRYSTMTAFVPSAPRVPFEIWICPRQHGRSFAELGEGECEELADLVFRCLCATQRDSFSPYFVAFYDMAPGSGDMHFRVEIVAYGRPDGSQKYLGPCELGLGIFVNAAAPADVVAFLQPRL
jgi:UDPglucose--hexose-1-phosphate uridylyltransferase